MTFSVSDRKAIAAYWLIKPIFPSRNRHTVITPFPYPHFTCLGNIRRYAHVGGPTSLPEFDFSVLHATHFLGLALCRM